MWLGLKLWHCTSMAQKTCCTRTVAFASLIIREKCINETQESNYLFHSFSDGNKSLMQTKHYSISHYGRINKKPRCLLCALRKANLVYLESHKGNPPTRECFTKPSLEMWLDVFGSGGWGSFSSTFMSNKEKRETGLGPVPVIQSDEIRQKTLTQCNLWDPQWQP